MVNILFDLVKIKLSTAILGDVLDLMPPDQFLAQQIQAVRARHHAGRARDPGAVLDGFVRDSGRIRQLGFSDFFPRPLCAGSGRAGRDMKYRLPVQIDGVSISPADLIFGDDDGVLIVPAAHEREAAEAAMEKLTADNRVAEAIRGDMSATRAYQTSGAN